MVAPADNGGKAQATQLFRELADKLVMRSPSLRHEESSPDALALLVHREIVEIARTESRIISDSLQRHALRLLEHVAATSGVAMSRSRIRSAGYAKLALLKLGAVLEAASCERASTVEKRTRVLACLRRLELVLGSCLMESPQRPARDTRAPSSKTNLRRHARRAPKTAFATIHELVEVDRPTEMARVTVERTEIEPTGTS